jgi:uncharacterized repeat protein (TIGR02543 family)
LEGPSISYTVTTSPPGLEIIVDASPYTSPQTFSWSAGSSHTLSVSSPQSGSSGTQYVFFSWSDGLAQTHTIETPSSSRTYIAKFKPQYALTTSANPTEGGTVAPGGTTWYDSSKKMSVSANANPGYSFSGWSGDLSTQVNPASITMTGSKSVTANFVPTSITSQSPSDGATFGPSSLLTKYQPTFSWISLGTFKSYTILFSTSPTDFTSKGIAVTKANIPVIKTSFTPAIAIWKAIMSSSYNKGSIRDIYWKITGKSQDKTVFETEARSFNIEAPQEVTVNAPQNGAVFSVSPDFEFNSNGNIKFKLELSSQSVFDDPKKIRAFTFTIKDPNVEQVIHRTLTSSQWNTVKKLVGTTAGYFRIRAWDGIKRETVSEARSFTVQ